MRRQFLILALTLAVTAFLIAQPAQAQPHAFPTSEALQSATLPVRDRFDLARRLLGLNVTPTVKTKPAVYNVGDRRTFKASNLDEDKQFEVEAQLWLKTDLLYMWFEVGFTPDVEALKRSAANFETQIYPVVHRYFGQEASPGIDGDPRLIILHAHNLGKGIAGYFDSDSEYPVQIVPDSNEGQMFFIGLDTMGKIIGTRDYESVLAHEFQHMVRANVEPREASWIDEGFAEMAAALTGYRDSSGYVRVFAEKPGVQLTTWPADAPSGPHYGASYLFLTYFLGRFGDDGLRILSADPRADLAGVRSALTTIISRDSYTGPTVTFEDIFADWTAANLLNDSSIADGRFGYTRLPSKLPDMKIAGSLAKNVEKTIDLTQFGATYLRLPGPGTYTLNFDAPAIIPAIPAVSQNGSFYFWSNRGDRISTRLTRAFDLRSVSAATLNYALWYAIEPEWDYAYVQVSSDGGKTWQVVPSGESVAAGGHNNPYGPAYTGISGGETTPANGQWVNQQIDLSKFAGKEILVRFELVTDDAVNLPGLAIDDIRIPEIGYQADFEQGNDGWQAEGFVRIDNRLPGRYLAQVVESGAQSRVTRLIGPEDGNTRTVTFEVLPGTERAVLVLSGLTDFTTEKAQVKIVLR